ncbi:ATP-binding cassette sub-family B member 10, mitochondrial [Armadillidium vulgare]|nr:ATP-binding cassette sub-family B member 10, mitochondrial [Armadillidium vulgare]
MIMLINTTKQWTGRINQYRSLTNPILNYVINNSYSFCNNLKNPKIYTSPNFAILSRNKLIKIGTFDGSYRHFSSQNEEKGKISNLKNNLNTIQGINLQKVKVNEVRRLFLLAKPETSTLAAGIALLAFSSSITMAVPFALGHVIDVIYTADPVEMKQNLKNVCLGLVGLFVTGGLANFGRVYLMNIAAQRITRNLRSSVFSSIIKQEITFFDMNRTGELINRLSADTSTVSQSVTLNISDGLRSMVMVIAGVGMMFYMSADLAVVGLSIVPPVAIMAIFYGKYLKRISKNVQDTLAESTQVAEERISNIRTVRSFAQEMREMGEYDKQIDNVLKLTYKESLARGLFFGTLVTESALSVGSLSSFLLYAAYVGVAFGGLSSFYSELNKGLGASTRLFQLMERVPSMPFTQGLQLPQEEFQGHISIRNISFGYPTRSDRPIFNSFSLEVPAGNIIAIVGASGSGKSTIGSLLLRFYDPQEGEILLDSHPLHELDPLWLRSRIASEPSLFSTTIYENILYGCRDRDDVTREDVMKAAREANALSFIESFPEKFETVVGERGVMLSGGQKQRIAIARAIISNPKILILDEATSALDAESENLVQEALEKLMKNRTVITIAHRLSTISMCEELQ